MTACHRHRALIAAMLPALALAGCGGGGDGTTSTPTPPPAPPPTGVNADLTGALKSETFANQSSIMTAAYTQTNQGGTFGGQQGSLQVIYDAAQQAYRLTDSGLTQTFAPANIDKSQSNATVTTYKLVEGKTTSFLSLVKNGTGAGQTRYVGAGYWQRSTEGSNTVDARLQGFTYGAQTPASAMPTTGAAAYAVSLVGVKVQYQAVFSLAGQGKLQVDFASGGVFFKVPYAATDLRNGLVDYSSSVMGFGLIKSGTNAFTGGLLDATTTTRTASTTDGVQGAFYGPQAEEVGAAFYGYDQNSAIAGAIYGGRDASYQPPTGLQAPDGGFFALRSSGFKASIAANGKAGTAAAIAPLVAVYSGLAVDRYFRANGEVIAGPMIDYFPGLTAVPFYQDKVRSGLVWELRDGTMQVDTVLYGATTAPSAIPTSGIARYAANIQGIASTADAIPQTFGGNGNIVVDLANGTLDLAGTYATHDFVNKLPKDYSWSGPNGGTWSGSARLASGTNGFSGDFKTTGALTYNGTVTGAFFDTDASDIGATIDANSTAGGRMLATLGAAYAEDITAASKGLAALTKATTLPAYHAQYVTTPNDFFGTLNYAATPGAADFAYDPATGNYTIRGATGFGIPSSYTDYLLLTVAGAQRSATASTASFDAYQGDGYTARILRANAPAPDIALTYTSFAQITRHHLGFQPDAIAQHYIVFGATTPDSAVPTTGKATYRGIVYGSGADGKTGHQATLSGTSTLDADFGANRLALTLGLTATDATTGAARALGDFLYTGAIAQGCTGPSCDRSAINLSLVNAFDRDNTAMGQFNGAHAEEFGVAFRLDPSVNSHYAGVALGKRD